MSQGQVGRELVEGAIDLWAMAEGSGGKRPRSRAMGKSGCPTSDEGVYPMSDKSIRPTLTPKQLGEIAEAEFIAKAVEMGYAVAKPWGDSEKYDFIVNARKNFNFWRTQVKSAHVVGEDGGYSFRAHDHNNRPYSSEDIDALVTYAKPADAWYLMPVRVVEGLRSLKLYPGSRRKRSKYERWREGWELFKKRVRRVRKR
jgi:hypothetical protein